MSLRNITFTFIISVSLAGCASSKLSTEATVLHSASGDTYHVSDGSVKFNKPGYYVVYQKNKDQASSIADVSRLNPKLDDWKTKEILHISDDLSEVQPMWRTFYGYDKGNSAFICWAGALRTSGDNRRNDYNPCDSALMKTVITGKDVAATSFVAVFSFGLGAITGTSKHSVQIDLDAVKKLIDETHTMNRVRDAKAFFALQDAKEQEQRRMQQEEMRKEQEAARKRMEAQRREEAAARQKREAQYDQWRKTLATGSATFCGFVVERRGPMIKVALIAQLPGYAAEQWININQAYPESFGCRNVNGRLSPQAAP